jgi:hypothetical protein
VHNYTPFIVIYTTCGASRSVCGDIYTAEGYAGIVLSKEDDSLRIDPPSHGRLGTFFNEYL